MGCTESSEPSLDSFIAVSNDASFAAELDKVQPRGSDASNALVAEAGIGDVLGKQAVRFVRSPPTMVKWTKAIRILGPGRDEFCGNVHIVLAFVRLAELVNDDECAEHWCRAIHVLTLPKAAPASKSVADNKPAATAMLSDSGGRTRSPRDVNWSENHNSGGAPDRAMTGSAGPGASSDSLTLGKNSSESNSGNLTSGSSDLLVSGSTTSRIPASNGNATLGQQEGTEIGARTFASRKGIAAALLKVAQHITSAQTARFWIGAVHSMTEIEVNVSEMSSLLPGVEKVQKVAAEDASLKWADTVAARLEEWQVTQAQWKDSVRINVQPAPGMSPR